MNWSPEHYLETAVIAKAAGEELLTRLEWMAIQPKRVIDLGCGTGTISETLQQRYPNTPVLAIDIAENMLRHAKQNTVNNNTIYICADGEKIPLATNTVDIIFANFLFPWLTNQQTVLNECQRVLRPNGLLMFTTLGPDTLKEWQNTFKGNLIPLFIDIHDIGDLLIQQGFSDPVLDVLHYTLTYKSVEKFISELSITGMIDNPPLGLDLNNLVEEENIAVTVEVIFVHAFVSDLETGYKTSEHGLTKIPLSHLRHQLNQ